MSKKFEIMSAVQKRVAEAYAPRGITLDYVGFAEGLDYDPQIQTAINDLYVAHKRSQAAAEVASQLPTMHQQADIGIKESVASAIKNKWDGKIGLPAFMVIPSGLMDWLGSWFKTEPKPVPAAASTTR